MDTANGANRDNSDDIVNNVKLSRLPTEATLGETEGGHNVSTAMLVGQDGGNHQNKQLASSQQTLVEHSAV